MFEELLEGPIARARQCESPLPDERRRFLSHLHTLGYAHSSLRAIACELIVIAKDRCSFVFSAALSVFVCVFLRPVFLWRVLLCSLWRVYCPDFPAGCCCGCCCGLGSKLPPSARCRFTR